MCTPSLAIVWMPDAMSSGLISLAPVAKLAKGWIGARSVVGLAQVEVGRLGHPVRRVDHAMQADDLRQAGVRAVDRPPRLLGQVGHAARHGVGDDERLRFGSPGFGSVHGAFRR